MLRLIHITEDRFKKIFGRYVIKESNSISSIVKNMSEYVFDKIKNDLPTQQLYTCKYTPKRYFKENEIQVDLSAFDNNFGTITVAYTVYIADNAEDFANLARYEMATLNSGFDNETNTMYITTYMDSNGILEDDVEGSIFHEFTHMYQYAMGLKKRENLYDTVKDIIEKPTLGEISYYTAVALYFTFPHEQDAFVHQYYAQYKENRNLSIDEFSYYRDFVTIINIVKNNKKSKPFIQTVKKLGYTPKTYFTRLKFGLKRFRKKLSNAQKAIHLGEMYSRLSNEAKMKIILEHTLRENKPMPVFNIERHYRFNN